MTTTYGPGTERFARRNDRTLMLLPAQRAALCPPIVVNVTARPDTPMGIPNGKTIYYAEGVREWAHPYATALLGSGCVLGRDYTPDSAVADFVRRARADGGCVERADLEVHHIGGAK